MVKTQAKGDGARALNREKRRGQILDAARKIFSEKGYHQTSVSDIVNSCGIAQGTFYLYFKSKREIFGALLDEFTGKILGAFFIEGAVEVRTGAQVYERFRFVAQNAARMFLDNIDLARLFLMEAAAKDPGFEDKVNEFYGVLINGAADNLEMWMERGLLRRADPHIIAHCVVGMIERLVVQWISGSIPVDIEAMVDEAVKFEVYGILKDPGEIFGGRP